MIKLFTPRVSNKVAIRVSDTAKAAELYRAKGVINNYLKDKKFSIAITDSTFCGDKFVDVKAIAKNGQNICTKSVVKEGDMPFLRNVYKAIDMLAKDFSILRK